MPTLSLTSVPDHCDPTSNFLAHVSNYFHLCVPTPLAFTSSLLGTLSIISWLFAQLPQIYKNYQIQSTAGLSIFFLLEWCLGDAGNLVGAVLTNQAGWQVVVAGYYVFVDVCLVFQYFWYTYTRPWLDGQSLHSAGSSSYGDGESDIINGLSPINSNFGGDEDYQQNEDDVSKVANGERTKPTRTSEPPNPVNEKTSTTVQHATNVGLGLSEKSNSSGTKHRPLINVQNHPLNSLKSPRTLLYISTLCALLSRTTASPTTHIPSTHHDIHTASTAEIAGTLTAWLSTFLYLGSRLPQLYMNFLRRSTAGLSPLLFAAAFCGNLFYSTSLLANPYAWSSFGPYGGHGWAGPEGSSRKDWVLAAMPFFLGAAGVLGLDFAMGVQFVIYGEVDEEKVVKVRDSEGGPGRWELVSGWMRGWVPSVKAEKRVSVAEGSALLTRSREMGLGRSLRESREYGTV
ncbi:MAG: hypothetical protein Q9160_007204 [Pyrenula sp. 1 TL-2023]